MHLARGQDHAATPARCRSRPGSTGRASTRFHFIGIWNNDFLPPVMLSDQQLYPVTLGLALWNSQTFRDPAFLEPTVTGAAVSALLLVINRPGVARRAGHTAGSVKG